ncbi:hypothetical protein [Planococcus faecalis]|uniref:DUF3139 domain-containing protein n=1 Tax=Planococcus faecalis TaxID=1598147 RepID=A0ABM6IV24_9BACL|nr:hypothetical protein [Planococcus faecalis]AQU79537.1 hypothetical protein AJGP001_09820 [Planococcus faecalis]OHX53158.1 hypothetical protein BB777_10880 [Planococcus faecalis]
MQPTTIIEISFILVVTALLSVVALFLRKPLKILILIAAGFILIGSIIFYSTRLIIVENQTNEAIQQLDTHLTNTFNGESWEIFDTDDYEIKKIKFLHVIFNNEPMIVYEYKVTESAIKQLSFWGKENGDNAEVLLENGIDPQHIE